MVKSQVELVFRVTVLIKHLVHISEICLSLKSFLKERDEYPEAINYAKATEEQVDHAKTPEEGDVAKTPEQPLEEAAEELPCGLQ